MTGAGTITLTMWRDHDEELLQLPALYAGSRPAAGPASAEVRPAGLAASLYQDGVRRVALDGPVDLSGSTGQDTVAAMLLLAELTGWGIVVDWEVRLGADPEIWQLLNHLYPPRAVLDTDHPDDLLDRWRAAFYVCKCIWRKGPGFVEVRDRRNGSLIRFVIDDPDYLRAIERLTAGCPTDAVPAPVLDDFVAEGLVASSGSHTWWLPYRVRRWPAPSLVV